MLNKKLMILTIFFISLLAISVVSAADNTTDKVVNVADNATDDIGSVEKTTCEIEIVCASDGKETVVSNENRSEEVISVEYQGENNLEYEILSANNVEDNKLTASIEDIEILGTAYVDLTRNFTPYLKYGEKEVMFKTPWRSKSINFEIYELYENGYYMSSASGTTNANNEGLCLIKHDFYGDFYLSIWTNSTDEKTYHILRSYSGETYVPPNINQNPRDDKTTHKSDKILTKIKVKSIKVKPKSKIYIKAKVYDKSNGKKVLSGKVKFKIMGKTYIVKVKKGIAKIKIKIPSKVKTYKCTAKYLGDKNNKKSSTKFKIIVKKPIVKKKTTKKKSTKKKSTKKKSTKKKKVKRSITIKPKFEKWKNKRNGKYVLSVAKFRITSAAVGYWVDVDIRLFKNGKQVSRNGYLSKVKYKYKGKTYWTKWRRGNEDHAYHRYVIFNHKVKVTKVKVKY